jgi:hypothetical protein
MELVLGNTLNLNGRSYQNYELGGSNFLPFGFSGAVINRSGDNVSAGLIFPNTQLTRPWASEAITGRWVAIVAVLQLTSNTTLYSYTGQVGGGNWDETAVRLELNTILDAVGGDVPFRSLSEDLVGPIPTSSNVRVF